MSYIPTFTLEEKRKLSNKISANRNKEDLLKIRNIIFEDNPNIPINRDSGGMLMFFQDLDPLTYIKLDKYVKEMERKRLKKQTNVITKTSDRMLSEMTDTNYMTSRSRYRYSNKERTIMKRKEYDDIITTQHNEQPPIEQKNKNTIFSKSDKLTMDNKRGIFTKNDPYASDKVSNEIKNKNTSDILCKFVNKVKSDLEKNDKTESTKKYEDNDKTKDGVNNNLTNGNDICLTKKIVNNRTKQTGKQTGKQKKLRH